MNKLILAFGIIIMLLGVLFTLAEIVFLVTTPQRHNMLVQSVKENFGISENGVGKIISAKEMFFLELRMVIIGIIVTLIGILIIRRYWTKPV